MTVRGRDCTSVLHREEEGGEEEEKEAKEEREREEMEEEEKEKDYIRGEESSCTCT